MSKADQLGTGRSFGHVPRGRSARGRAKAVTQGDVPAYELVRLHLDEVAPTPLNPRRNFGTDEDMTRFGEELRQAQLAACVVVSRDAYLALWPDHAERIGEVLHVLVNGERRYRSAVHVGLESLDFVVRDDLASSREEFINHLLQENLEREDFDVIERARGIEQLVTVCAEQGERGARARAAVRMRKDRSWVTNQLALLELPDEIQVMLSAGTLPERDGRALSRFSKDNPGLDAAALLIHLKTAKDAATKAKEEERAQLRGLRNAVPDGLLSADNNPSDQATRTVDPDDAALADDTTPATSLSADNNPDRAAGSPAANPASGPERTPARTGLLSADNKPARDVPASAKPGVPGQQRNGEHDPVTILLGDPRQIAAELKNRLALEQLTELTELLVEHVAAASDA